MEVDTGAWCSVISLGKIQKRRPTLRFKRQLNETENIQRRVGEAKLDDRI